MNCGTFFSCPLSGPSITSATRLPSCSLPHHKTDTMMISHSCYIGQSGSMSQSVCIGQAADRTDPHDASIHRRTCPPPLLTSITTIDRSYSLLHHEHRVARRKRRADRQRPLPLAQPAANPDGRTVSRAPVGEEEVAVLEVDDGMRLPVSMREHPTIRTSRLVTSLSYRAVAVREHALANGSLVLPCMPCGGNEREAVGPFRRHPPPQL